MSGGTQDSVFKTLFDEVVFVPVDVMVVKGKSTKGNKSKSTSNSKSKAGKQPSSKATKLPTRSPTTKSNVGIIYMAIRASISVSNVTVAGQGQRIRQHLIVTQNDTTTIMNNTIQVIVKSLLNANQSLLMVVITGIKDFFINGLLAGTTVDSEFVLTENCISTCEDQLRKTTINTTVISALNVSIGNGSFTKIFQENAGDQCVNTTCLEIKNGTVTGGVGIQ
jgi:hypothetical protein